MTGELFKTVIRISLVGAVIAGLLIIGNVINDLAIWSWLTDFFALIRKAIFALDFIIDTETLLKLVGYSFLIMIAYWSLKAIIWIAEFFNEK